MKNRKNDVLIKGMGIYAIGTFGTKILSFLIVPLYTYYISTTEMGIYDIINSTISLLIPIISMQVFDAAYRWIIQDDIKDKEKYIRATVQLVIINAVICSILIIIINRIHAVPFCGYVCIILTLSIFFQAIQKLLRGLNNQWLFAISGIVYSFVFLICNVVQIVVFNYGVESLFQSTVIASVISIILIFILEPRLRINYFKKTNLELIWGLYKYSVPLVPNQLNWWVINSSDRYIVMFALGSSANGILVVAHKFPSMLQSILNLFTSSWQDLSIAEGEQNDSEGYYTRVFYTYYSFALVALWAVIPLTKILMTVILSEAYRTSANYTAFYYLGTVFQAFSSFYGVGYLKSTKTSRAFSTSVYGAIVNAVINILLIKFLGIQAAAISTFVGFLVMWLIREKQNRCELGIQIKWIHFWGYTIISIIISVISICNGFLCNMILASIGCIAFLVLNKKIFLHIILKIKLLCIEKGKRHE